MDIKPPQEVKVNIISDINLGTSEEEYSTDNVKITVKDDQNALIKIPRSPSPENEDSQRPEVFKNLSFSFPNLKRKNNDFETKENQKKPKLELNDSDTDNGEEITVFNYLTGTYETRKRLFNEESTEPKEEPMLDEQLPLVEEEQPDMQPSPCKATKFEIPDTSWVNSLEGFKIIENINSLKHPISNNDSIESSIKGEPLNQSSSSIFKCNVSSNTISQASNLETESESPVIVLSSRSNSPVDFKEPPLIASNLQFPTVANTVNCSAAVTANGNIVLNSYIIMPVQSPDSRVDVNLESKPKIINNEQYVPEKKSPYSSTSILKKLLAEGGSYKTTTADGNSRLKSSRTSLPRIAKNRTVLSYFEPSEADTASISTSSETAPNQVLNYKPNNIASHSTTTILETLLTKGQSHEITTKTTCLPVRSSSSNKVQIREHISLENTSKVYRLKSPKACNGSQVKSSKSVAASKASISKSTLKKAQITKPWSDNVCLRLYKCPTCYHLSKSRFALVSHIFTTHLRTPLDLLSKCENCDFTCENERALEKHEKRHKKFKNIHCPVCDVLYQTNTGLVSHICSYHLHNYEIRLKCTLCTFECLGKQTMDCHEGLHKRGHLNSAQSHEDKSVSPENNVSFIDNGLFKAIQLSQIDSDTMPKLNKAPKNGLECVKFAKNKLSLKCASCEFECRDATELYQHENCHKKNTIFQDTIEISCSDDDSDTDAFDTVDCRSESSVTATAHIEEADNGVTVAPLLPVKLISDSSSDVLCSQAASSSTKASLKCASCEFECRDATELHQHENCHKKVTIIQDTIELSCSDDDSDTDAFDTVDCRSESPVTATVHIEEADNGVTDAPLLPVKLISDSSSDALCSQAASSNNKASLKCVSCELECRDAIELHQHENCHKKVTIIQDTIEISCSDDDSDTDAFDTVDCRSESPVIATAYIEEEADNGVTDAPLLPVKLISDSSSDALCSQATSSNTTTEATVDLPSKSSTHIAQICEPPLPKEVAHYPDTSLIATPGVCQPSNPTESNAQTREPPLPEEVVPDTCLLETDSPSELTKNNAQLCTPSLPKDLVPNSDSDVLKTSQVSQKKTAVPLKCALCEFECSDQTKLNQHQNCHKKKADIQESIEIISSDEETNAPPQKQPINTSQPIFITIPKGTKNIKLPAYPFLYAFKTLSGGTISVPVQVVNKQTTADSGVSVNKTIAPSVSKEQKDKHETDDESTSDSTDQSDDDWDSDTDQWDSEVDEEKSMRFYCYDCRSAVNGTIVQFRSHVAKHIGSKYSCMRHVFETNKDCLRCRYEKCLNSIQKYIKSCNTCGFATADSSVLAKHIDEKYGCQVWSTRSLKRGELKCFHCNYVTSRKRFLEFHAVDHVHKKCSCDKHKRKIKNEKIKCLDCIYEISLEKAKRDILECGDCGYKTVLIELFDVHTCKTNAHKKRSQVTTNCSDVFKCGHCKYKTDKWNLLTYHCKEHYNKSFKCAEHPNLKPSGCDKCTYLNVLNRANSALFTCKKCSFLTFNGFRLRMHITSKCDSAGGREYLKCFDCDIGYLQTLHLEEHAAVKHVDSKFRCPDHSASYVHTCLMCIYQKIIKDVKKGMSVHTSTCNITGGEPKHLKCFDCHIECANEYQLKEHAATKHTGSYFKCTDHTAFVGACLKCIYEKTIQDVKVNSTSSDPKNLKCFDCDIGYVKKSYLEKHAVKHVGSKFRCTEHSDCYVPTCLKCIYQKIIKYIDKSKSVCSLSCDTTKHLNCFECDIECANESQLIKHATAKHSGSNFTCMDHTSFVYACSKCTYHKIIKDIKHGMSTIPEYLKCFDCDIGFVKKSLLKEHVAVKHIRTKFRCTDHLTSYVHTCLKCNYSKIIKDMKNDTYTCTSTRNTVDGTKYIKCFECDIKCANKFQLLEHAGDTHIGSDFTCTDHTEFVHTCLKCIYEKNIKYVKNGTSTGTSTREPTVGEPKHLKCFECNKIYANEALLQEHAAAEHIGSDFTCTDHTEFVRTCLKCIYEKCIKDVKNGKSKCSVTLDTTDSEPESLKCFECDKKCANESQLKQHATAEHTGSVFTCTDHTAFERTCLKCIYEKIIKDVKNGITTGTSTRATTVGEPEHLKCFECDKIYANKALLKEHAATEHIGSDFTCTDHTEFVRTCLKCIYEKKIKDVENGTSSDTLTRETTVGEPEHIKCFECNKIYANEALLKEHAAAEHIRSDFTCTEHTEFVRTCLKCIYENIIKDVKNCTSTGTSTGETTVSEPEHLKCFECNKIYANETLLNEHTAAEHIGSDFTCSDNTEFVRTCLKWIYEKNIKDVINGTSTDTSTRETTVNEPEHLKCFECNKIYANEALLKEHAATEHIGSDFTCTDHTEFVRTCLKCIYEKSIKDMKNGTSTGTSTRETTVGEPEHLKCFECKKIYANEALLKEHAATEDTSSDFTCTDHTIYVRTCLKCIYEKNINDVENGTSTGTSTRETTVGEPELLKCFECNKIYANETLLKEHTAAEHIGSDFTCIDHTEFVRTCLKCIYETNCKDAENGTSSDTLTLETTVGEPEHLECFECNKIYANEALLKDHAATEHTSSDFTCTDHTVYFRTCLKCIYEKIIKDVKNGTSTDTSTRETTVGEPEHLKCFECNKIYTNEALLKEHAATEHIGSDFTCTDHTEFVRTCLKCIYEKSIKDLKNDTSTGTSTRETTVGEPEHLKCFECNKIYANEALLKEHAATEHTSSDFTCTDHTVYVRTCLKCIYEKIIKDVENGTSTGTSTREITVGEPELIKCCECNKVYANKTLLKDHAATEHTSSDFTCADHNVYVRTCIKCIYEKIIKDVENGTPTGTSTLETTVGEPEHLKCFECNKIYANEALLKEHAATEHIGSDFTCTDHTEFLRTCLKCIYEKSIKDMKNGTSTPTSTRETTVGEPEHLKCFECNKIYANEALLKEHAAVEHTSSDFTCTDHTVYVRTCLKCIYEKNIKDAENGTTTGTSTLDTTIGDPEHVKCFECAIGCDNCDVHKARGPGKTVKSRHTVDVELLKKYSCFDCSNGQIFKDESELRQHVSSNHGKSSFACTRHFKEKNSGCDKCLYWRIVKDVLKDQYAVPLICWDCKEEQFPQRESLETHIISKHLDSEFECDDHLWVPNQECSKCLYESMLQSSTKKFLPIFKCFDCDFSCETLHEFRKHVHFSHRNSQFKCGEHAGRSKNFFEKCPACFYCIIAKNRIAFLKCFMCVSNHLLHTNNVSDVKKHILKYHHCTKALFVCRTHTIGTNSTRSINCTACWFQRYLKSTIAKKDTLFQCYYCSYKIYRLDLLKLHIKENHKNANFHCKLHVGRAKDNFENCPECFFAAIGMDKRPNDISAVLRCYECAPATTFRFIGNLRKHLLEAHDTCTFSCSRHYESATNCGKCWFQCYAQRILEEEQDFFYCFECNFPANSYNSLKTHVEVMHKNSEFKCDKHETDSAPEDSCKKCSYAQLVQKHSSNLRCYKCETQTVYFPDVKSLKSHIRKNYQAFSFVCPQHASADDRCCQCVFQAIVEETFSYNCEECPIGTLELKTEAALKRHIKSTHLPSKFTCHQHCLSTEPDVCNKCAYETLVQTCINDCKKLTHQRRGNSMAPRTRLNLANGIQFVCFDCYFRVFDIGSMKDHICQNHIDSTFMCTKHSLGNIDDACAECSYENLVLLSKEEYVIELD